MKHVAVSDLSAQLPSLLDDVARGEEITLMSDGQPVARLVAAAAKPIPEAEFTPEEIDIRREAVRRLKENARAINLNVSQEEIKSWIEEGRH